METSSKPNLAFAKIVATPSIFSWSQSYNAGKLFAVLSLKKPEGEENPSSLNEIGKELLEKLEQEFFTTEEKNLDSIKDAIEKAFLDFPVGITFSFAACVINTNILYAFSKNGGTILFKRGDKFGMLLNEGSSSGFLEDKDLIMLTTKPFIDSVPSDAITQSVTSQTPTEIAESLSPLVHEKEESGASAIVIHYVKQEPEPAVLVEEPVETPPQEPQESSPKWQFPALKKYLVTINHRKKVFLTVAIAVFLILVFSVFSALKKQEDTKRQALFANVYSQAEKKYEEGQSLVDLNKNLARDNFEDAKKILDDGKSKFSKNSNEEKQILDLLNKVNSGLAQVSTVEAGIDRSKLSVAVQNGSGAAGVAGQGKNILKELGYNVVSTANADNYNYQGVTIKVKKEKSNFLELLKKDLSKTYTITLASSDLPFSSPTDALIIIGK